MENYGSQQRELQKAIMSVAGNFPGEWRDVGRSLGLSEAVLHGIVSDNRGDIREMQHQMLQKWKKGEGSLATLSALANALREAGRKDLAETLKQEKSPNAFPNKQKTSSSDDKTLDAEQQDSNKIVRQVNYYILLPAVIPFIAYIAYFMITNYGIDNRNHELNGRKTYSAGTQKLTDDIMEPNKLEDAIFYVKNELTTQWRDVGKCLGLPHADIEHINEEYGNKPKERNYQLLQKWREQKGNHATLEVLLDALRKAEREDLADNLLKEIQKEGTKK